MTDEYKNLHAAALQFATHLMAQADQSRMAPVEAALQGGAVLVMEIGPLPDLQQVSIVLVEREGRRHRVVSISARPEVLQ